MTVERLFLFDTSTLSYNNIDTNLITSFTANKKWICTSNSIQQLNKIDVFLFYRWFQPCTTLWEYQLSLYKNAILSTNHSTKIKELPIHFTKHGILKIKNSTLSLKKIINETRTLDFYCEKKCQQINQECCVCYEHSDTKHFVTFKCNHSICVECFKKIKKGGKLGALCVGVTQPFHQIPKLFQRKILPINHNILNHGQTN